MQKTSSLLLNIQATLIDPSFSKEANIGECIRIIVNYSPDELVSLIYMFKSILDTSLLMLVKSLVGLSSLISAPCL